MKHSEKKYTAWLNIWDSQHSITGLLNLLSNEMHTLPIVFHADAPLDCNSWLNKAVNKLPLKVNRKREHCEVLRLPSPTAWSEFWFGEDESRKSYQQSPQNNPSQYLTKWPKLTLQPLLTGEILTIAYFSRTFLRFKNTQNLDVSLGKVYIY